MTFSIGHVEGGTGAGRRRVIDKKYVPWPCECKVDAETWDKHFYMGKKFNPGYLKNCIDCGTDRP